MTKPDICIQHLQHVASGDSYLQEDAFDLLMQWENPPQDARSYLTLMLMTERVLKIAAAGRADDPVLIAKLDDVQPKNWAKLAELPFDRKQQIDFGRDMLKQVDLYPQPQPGKHIMIQAGMIEKLSIEAAVQHCLDHDLPLDVIIDDAEFDTALINALSAEETRQLAELMRQRYVPINTHVIFRTTNPPELEATRNEDNFEIYAGAQAENMKQRVGDKIRWILTYSPTEHEAAMEGMSFEDYVKFTYESRHQPWKQITEGQQTLIDKAFNKGKVLHFTNSDGTDITVPIGADEKSGVANHTFANSVIGRNYPGSEMFSGPAHKGLTGTLVAKGNFSYGHGVAHPMKDLTLKIVDGEVIEGRAEKGQEWLDAFLSKEDGLDPSDEKYRGSRRIGEIGIGTNPYIRQHMVNGLLVEKISGSFHLALGDSYKNSYLGEEVFMDNGNRSGQHWDITTMLRGKDGRMEVDGHLIQKDGEWVACPELGITEKDVDVLNRGWAAVPEAQRPPYWRKKLAVEAEVTR